MRLRVIIHILHLYNGKCVTVPYVFINLQCGVRKIGRTDRDFIKMDMKLTFFIFAEDGKQIIGCWIIYIAVFSKCFQYI